MVKETGFAEQDKAWFKKGDKASKGELSESKPGFFARVFGEGRKFKKEQHMNSVVSRHWFWSIHSFNKKYRKFVREFMPILKDEKKIANLSFKKQKEMFRTTYLMAHDLHVIYNWAEDYVSYSVHSLITMEKLTADIRTSFFGSVVSQEVSRLERDERELERIALHNQEAGLITLKEFDALRREIALMRKVQAGTIDAKKLAQPSISELKEELDKEKLFTRQFEKAVEQFNDGHRKWIKKYQKSLLPGKLVPLKVQGQMLADMRELEKRVFYINNNFNRFAAECIKCLQKAGMSLLPIRAQFVSALELKHMSKDQLDKEEAQLVHRLDKDLDDLKKGGIVQAAALLDVVNDNAVKKRKLWKELQKAA